MTTTATKPNPLLIGEGLPPFPEIEPQHVVSGIQQLLAELDTQLTELEQTVKPTWEGVVEPLTEIEERLTWSWGIVSHLMGVKNSQDLREAYETVQPEVVRFINKLNQSKPIYEAFKALRHSEEWNRLDDAQKRIVESSLQDAELSGVGLEGETKERFNAIQLELADLSTQFSNHVLDATKAFKLKLTTPEEVAGLPQSALNLAAQT
ncbi:MAG: M3 family peptidase, partial [Halothece sp. Uz-M2-17]|nr:M3 family peptidase [Halothece sp. Uz-M2-17]